MSITKGTFDNGGLFIKVTDADFDGVGTNIFSITPKEGVYRVNLHEVRLATGSRGTIRYGLPTSTGATDTFYNTTSTLYSINQSVTFYLDGSTTIYFTIAGVTGSGGDSLTCSFYKVS